MGIESQPYQQLQLPRGCYPSIESLKGTVTSSAKRDGGTSIPDTARTCYSLTRESRKRRREKTGHVDRVDLGGP